jgi:hypothetical protein
MQAPEPPKITGIEVVAAQPTEAESAKIAQLSAETNRALPQVAYVVKVRLKTKPPVTSMGWGLYVNDVRVPKYWEYDEGIYFTVLDPQFFTEHKGKRLRFSQNGVDFYDTGMKLAAATEPRVPSKSKRKAAKSKTVRLPLQSDVLK